MKADACCVLVVYLSEEMKIKYNKYFKDDSMTVISTSNAQPDAAKNASAVSETVQTMQT
jgi:hypothetical protein